MYIKSTFKLIHITYMKGILKLRCYGKSLGVCLLFILRNQHSGDLVKVAASASGQKGLRFFSE